MTLRPYKFVVQAIVQDVDDATGDVVGERASDPITLFGCEAVASWANEFPAQLAGVEKTTPEAALVGGVHQPRRDNGTS